MKAQVLLLGNGINDVTNNYKWGDLITDLIDYAGLHNIQVDKNKPFPFLYEEIYLTNLKSKKLGEADLKGFISKKLRSIKTNEIHKKICSWNLSNIITTNYDYTIESVYGYGFNELKNEGAVRETLYSVFRHRKIKKTKIWHIHGEIKFPNSILLGNEQYGGNLQHIRNYVAQGNSVEYKNYISSSLVSRIKEKIVKYDSWLDLVFLKNIHIVGLTLDFTESDLWWLLTFRARNKLERKIPIKNKIVYYYPNVYKGKIQYKLDMLEANEVATVGIGKHHDESYYEQVFAYIENRF